MSKWIGERIMFGYKRSISLCAKFHEISVKQIKNNISQCKITKNLGLSTTTIHNIVKRFRESREISVCVGQGRKPQVNVHDLWALRWHCIRNHHAVVLNISTRAQEYFRKTAVIYHSLQLHYEIQLESLLCKEKAICQFYAVMPQGSLGQSSSQIIKKTVEMCAGVRWVHISACSWEKQTSNSQSQRLKGPTRLSPATDAKARQVYLYSTFHTQW